MLVIKETEKILQFIKNIPEDELPEVLTSLVERGIDNQVRPIVLDTEQRQEDSSISMILRSIQELKSIVGNSSSNTQLSKSIDDVIFNVKQVVSSSEAGLDDISISDDLFDSLMK